MDHLKRDMHVLKREVHLLVANPIEILRDVFEAAYFKQLQNRWRAAFIFSSLGYEMRSEDLLKLLN